MALAPTQWKKWCVKFGGQPLPGEFEEVAKPSFSGRSRYCRPALEILKGLILSGDAPPVAFEKELARLRGADDPLRGLVKNDLNFLLQMGPSWKDIYIPNQKLDALARSTGDSDKAIRTLIASQNDPIVRHRLTVFSERLDELAAIHGTPDSIVLEFVREDFMGKKAKMEYVKFQRERASERAKARDEAAKAGATEGAAGLKMELLKSQSGVCLYTGAGLKPTSLDEYCIDHIVPRTKGGPDAAVNYVLTTRRANDDKGDRTPYEWLSKTEGWDAYVERVRKRIGALRNKKAQLLTSQEAETLVQKYTALAETAWISKLAQTIIGLKFGWPNGILDGERKVTIVSGGLTGRIRRKYKLNSLLNPDAKTEEEAEKKNRNDDRHHALDAMVISFIPGWARDQSKEHFFRFPPSVHQNARGFFATALEEVRPRCLALPKAGFEETFYGMRTLNGHSFAVGREDFVNLGVKNVRNQRELKPIKDIETHRIVDDQIRRDVEDYLKSTPPGALSDWEHWCRQYRVGKNGSQVKKVLVRKSGADATDEYADVSKVPNATQRGQFKRGNQHKGYFVYERLAPTKKEPDRKQIAVKPVFVFQNRETIAQAFSKDGNSKVHGFFQSGCQVALGQPWEFRGRTFPIDEYILTSVWSDGRAKLRHPKFGEIGPVGLATLLKAGLARLKS